MGYYKYISGTRTATYDETLGEYFHWLCGLVDINNPDHSHFFLATRLNEISFYWSVCNDDNRAEDGKKLREIFAMQTDLRIGDVFFEEGCSVLEMLIALAMRMNDILSDGEEDLTTICFWELIENLGLGLYDDEHFYIARNDHIKVDKIIDKLLDRTYQKSGKGGLFPLKRSRVDQRKVEIWYQMQAYLDEKV